jgi:hypothetical protein
LEDIDPTWANQSIEKLIAQEDLELIRSTYHPHLQQLGKKQLHLAIQEMIAASSPLGISEKTVHNFQKILAELSNRLSELSSLD